MIRIKPEDYKDYQSCLWTITVPENKKLMLRFDKKVFSHLNDNQNLNSNSGWVQR